MVEGASGFADSAFAANFFFKSEGLNDSSSSSDPAFTSLIRGAGFASSAPYASAEEVGLEGGLACLNIDPPPDEDRSVESGVAGMLAVPAEALRASSLELVLVGTNRETVAGEAGVLKDESLSELSLELYRRIGALFERLADDLGVPLCGLVLCESRVSLVLGILGLCGREPGSRGLLGLVGTYSSLDVCTTSPTSSPATIARTPVFLVESPPNTVLV
mmetsp:Transcript_29294/g.80488  ORF Transcript_29294/g.80488 Transcript_29294/m.80488 type:complete len:218 (-) Transcript_29294:2572-3225(-)